MTHALEVTPAVLECTHEAGCITCGDRAEEVRVLKVDDDRGLALCAGRGDVHETVEIALVGPVAPGDVLLVHAGTAIARIGEAAA